MDNLVVLKNKIIALRENNQLDAIDSIMPTALNHTRAAIRVSLMNLTQPKYLEKLSNKELRSLLQDIIVILTELYRPTKASRG